MALNLSRVRLPHYSSDRIAELIGNGLLTLLTKPNYMKLLAQRCSLL